MYLVIQTKTVGQRFLQIAATRWNKQLFLLAPFGFCDRAGGDGNAVIWQLKLATASPKCLEMFRCEGR